MVSVMWFKVFSHKKKDSLFFFLAPSWLNVSFVYCLENVCLKSFFFPFSFLIFTYVKQMHKKVQSSLQLIIQERVKYQ